MTHHRDSSYSPILQKAPSAVSPVFSSAQPPVVTSGLSQSSRHPFTISMVFKPHKWLTIFSRRDKTRHRSATDHADTSAMSELADGLKKEVQSLLDEINKLKKERQQLFRDISDIMLWKSQMPSPLSMETTTMRESHICDLLVAQCALAQPTVTPEVILRILDPPDVEIGLFGLGGQTTPLGAENRLQVPSAPDNFSIPSAISPILIETSSGRTLNRPTVAISQLAKWPAPKRSKSEGLLGGIAPGTSATPPTPTRTAWRNVTIKRVPAFADKVVPDPLVAEDTVTA